MLKPITSILITLFVSSIAFAAPSKKLNADKALQDLIMGSLSGALSEFGDGCQSTANYDVRAQILTISIQMDAPEGEEGDSIELSLSRFANGDYTLNTLEKFNGDYYEEIYTTPSKNQLKIFYGDDAFYGIEIRKTVNGIAKTLRCEVWI